MKKRIDIMNHPWLFKIIMNSWPPYLGAGIYVETISPEWQRISVAMKLRWYNRNYVNSHFGGNLFSMTDPFYMLMLLRNLGNDYVVWDTSARIKFLKPGRSNVSAHFELEKTRMEEIREKAATGETVLERFHVDVVDESGGRIATVAKTLYIKKKVRTQKDMDV